jgi:hypothetical protein
MDGMKEEFDQKFDRIGKERDGMVERLDGMVEKLDKIVYKTGEKVDGMHGERLDRM